MNCRFFQFYCLVELLNSKVHFTFLKIAQAEIVVNTWFVCVEIDRYFEFVYTGIEVTQFSVVYS